MKTLLMATDLSARSDRALERALSLTREHGSRLTIVHVVDEELPAALADAQETTAKKTIREHVDSLTTGTDASISIDVVFGWAHVAILDIAEKTEANMIILGLHRESAFKDMFRGTTVELVIRASDVPVLLVKDRVRGAYGRVMVAVDFSVYSRRAVEFALEHMPDADFHLVHAYDVPFKGFLYGDDTRRQVSKQHQVQFEQMIDEEMAAFLSSLEAKSPKIDRVMQEGGPLQIIHRQVARLKPDLLAVGTHGRTGVAHAVLGSVAEDLLRNPLCDVLAVKAW